MEKRDTLPGARWWREHYRWASTLALITVFYNVLEGLVSVLFGLEDGTVSLFGFGLDSFVEVVSGIGVWLMIQRLSENEDKHPGIFEQQALKITGWSFYILAAGLVLTAITNIMTGHRPDSTFWGIIVGVISIATMWALIRSKIKVGEELESDAILADAECTRACLYLSGILVVSSLIYQIFKIGWIDSLGAIGIAAFSFKEGREALRKSRGKSCGCSRRASNSSRRK